MRRRLRSARPTVEPALGARPLRSPLLITLIELPCAGFGRSSGSSIVSLSPPINLRETTPCLGGEREGAYIHADVAAASSNVPRAERGPGSLAANLPWNNGSA